MNESAHSNRQSLIRYLMMILLAEKVIQHVVVTISFLFDVGNIRSTVAVNYEILMISGGIVAVLFAATLWGIINRSNRALRLVPFLALFDIVGEFIAQGTIFIDITVSILVATVLLVLSYLQHRKNTS